MVESRIPQLTGTSKRAAFVWLAALHKRKMLFCLDDDPHEIRKISDGSRLFTKNEAIEVSKILNRLFIKFGDELHELAFEVLSRTFHTKAERSAFKNLNG